MTDVDYVLGTRDAELARLGLQHRVWRPRALDAWRRAGFTVDQTILDVGCGPGFASADLAEIAGRVIAIDQSSRFLEFLRSRGFHNVETHQLDLDRDPLPGADAHGAWVRWVFAFLRHPRELVKRIAASLRHGGLLVIHEYFDYATWRFLQRSDPFENFVATVMRSWRASGGEPDIGRALPGWLEEEGFRIVSMKPIVDVISPADFTWQWPRTFVEVGLDRLVELGEFTTQMAKEVRDEFTRLEATPHVRMTTPAVLEVIAQRQII